MCRMPGFRERFPAAKPLIGVIHLPPLPGYEGSPGLAAATAHALADLATYRVGGLDGVLVENEHDRPHRVEAARETIAAMTAVTRELVAAAGPGLPVGVEILLNDPEASLAVALAAGAAFIRTDYWVDEMRRPEYGAMRIAPAEVIAYRSRIGADDVLVLADIQVKYAEMLAPRTLAESARRAHEAGADALVVTGTRTGEPPSPADVEAARAGAGACPILVGSGLAPGNAPALLAVADGAVVGTSLLADGHADARRVAALASARP
jgi:membrane complex biogenesis BtpA family protein